jgi:hypothetical protein
MYIESIFIISLILSRISCFQVPNTHISNHQEYQCKRASVPFILKTLITHYAYKLGDGDNTHYR